MRCVAQWRLHNVPTISKGEILMISQLGWYQRFGSKFCIWFCLLPKFTLVIHWVYSMISSSNFGYVFTVEIDSIDWDFPGLESFRQSSSRSSNLRYQGNYLINFIYSDDSSWVRSLIRPLKTTGNHLLQKDTSILRSFG